MRWLPITLAGPILWAISTHLDKYLVERYFKGRSVAVLLVFTALIGLLLLPFIFAYVPGVCALPVRSVSLIALTGVLYMAAMYFYLQALQSNEASVVAPFFQTAPIFAYALAYAVLGERLSRGEVIAGGLIVAGTALLSIEPGHAGPKVNVRLVALMLACAFSLALSSVIFKLFALRDEFWPTTFWTYVGEAVFGVGVLAVPAQRRLFMLLLRSSTGAVLAINGVNEAVNLAGSLLFRYALLLAPLGLVQAVGSTASIFVFLFGIALSVFFPSVARENLSRGDLLRKALAVTLVALGVVRVALP
ncbi:MAG TPA: EamA family transporter [Candidatus Dormibacteraeota bacterium]|nr:EamA family transporter [Candidatus Dormibacteraeota bacterium]